MDLPESVVHSFIVKLWFDGTEGGPRRLSWHGQITHVPGGERRSFKDLDEMNEFIEPYLEELGADVGRGRRVRRWLRRFSWRLA